MLLNSGAVDLIAVAAGDWLLTRRRDDHAGFANGDFMEAAHVDPTANRIVFTDGRELPPDFAAWTYGHAITAYRSQGSTSEESLLVLGDVAALALARRQFYVGNARFRGAHAIYVVNRDEILARLNHTDDGRELATEFMQRQRTVSASTSCLASFATCVPRFGPPRLPPRRNNSGRGSSVLSAAAHEPAPHAPKREAALRHGWRLLRKDAGTAGAAVVARGAFATTPRGAVVPPKHCAEGTVAKANEATWPLEQESAGLRRGGATY